VTVTQLADLRLTHSVQLTDHSVFSAGVYKRDATVTLKMRTQTVFVLLEKFARTVSVNPPSPLAVTVTLLGDQTVTRPVLPPSHSVSSASVCLLDVTVTAKQRTPTASVPPAKFARTVSVSPPSPLDVNVTQLLKTLMLSVPWNSGVLAASVSLVLNQEDRDLVGLRAASSTLLSSSLLTPPNP